MDLKNLKEKAKELQKKASENLDKAIDYSAKKLSESNLIISKKEDLEKVIKKSKTTKFKNKETGEEKEYKHKSIIIFAEEGSDFFKDALYALPVLTTKAFTQNIVLKITKSKIEGVDLNKFKIKTLPCLVVFEEEKNIKTIEGSENILKLVKNIDLDINKLIEKA